CSARQAPSAKRDANAIAPIPRHGAVAQSVLRRPLERVQSDLFLRDPMLQQRGNAALAAAKPDQPLGVPRIRGMNQELFHLTEAPAAAHALQVLLLRPALDSREEPALRADRFRPADGLLKLLISRLHG